MLNSIVLGDCLEVMQTIPDKSVDMILCDLPYGTTQCKWDGVIPFGLLWEQYKRIIKDNGAIVLTASQPFTSALVMSSSELFRYEWIWEKTYATGYGNANKMPMKNHENVLVFYKRLPTYNPQNLQRVDKIVKRGGAGEFMGASGLTVGDCNVQKYTNYPRTIQKFKKEKTMHPTQKPVALFEYLIKTYTNEGETVLDNCMGSGTTAIACINTGRNFIGIEKDEQYHKIAVERIAKHAK